IIGYDAGTDAIMLSEWKTSDVTMDGVVDMADASNVIEMANLHSEAVTAESSGETGAEYKFNIPYDDASFDLVVKAKGTGVAHPDYKFDIAVTIDGRNAGLAKVDYSPAQWNEYVISLGDLTKSIHEYGSWPHTVTLTWINKDEFSAGDAIQWGGVIVRDSRVNMACDLDANGIINSADVRQWQQYAPEEAMSRLVTLTKANGSQESFYVRKNIDGTFTAIDAAGTVYNTTVAQQYITKDMKRYDITVDAASGEIVFNEYLPARETSAEDVKRIDVSGTMYSAYTAAGGEVTFVSDAGVSYTTRMGGRSVIIGTTDYVVSKTADGKEIVLRKHIPSDVTYDGMLDEADGLVMDMNAYLENGSYSVNANISSAVFAFDVDYTGTFTVDVEAKRASGLYTTVPFKIDVVDTSDKDGQDRERVVGQVTVSMTPAGDLVVGALNNVSFTKGVHSLKLVWANDAEMKNENPALSLFIGDLALRDTRVDLVADLNGDRAVTTKDLAIFEGGIPTEGRVFKFVDVGTNNKTVYVTALRNGEYYILEEGTSGEKVLSSEGSFVFNGQTFDIAPDGQGIINISKDGAAAGTYTTDGKLLLIDNNIYKIAQEVVGGDYTLIAQTGSVGVDNINGSNIVIVGTDKYLVVPSHVGLDGLEVLTLLKEVDANASVPGSFLKIQGDIFKAEREGNEYVFGKVIPGHTGTYTTTGAAQALQIEGVYYKVSKNADGKIVIEENQGKGVENPAYRLIVIGTHAYEVSGDNTVNAVFTPLTAGAPAVTNNGNGTATISGIVYKLAFDANGKAKLYESAASWTSPDISVIRVDNGFHQVTELAGDYTVTRLSSAGGAVTVNNTPDPSILTAGGKTYTMHKTAEGLIYLAEKTEPVTDTASTLVEIKGIAYDVAPDGGIYTFTPIPGKTSSVYTVESVPDGLINRVIVTLNDGDMFEVVRENENITLRPYIKSSTLVTKNVVLFEYESAGLKKAFYEAVATPITGGYSYAFTPLNTGAPVITVSGTKATININGQDVKYDIIRDSVDGSISLALEPIRSTLVYNQQIRISIGGDIYTYNVKKVNDPGYYEFTDVATGDYTTSNGFLTEVVLREVLFDIVIDTTAGKEDIKLIEKPVSASESEGAIKTSSTETPDTTSTLSYEGGAKSSSSLANTYTMGTNNYHVSRAGAYNLYTFIDTATSTPYLQTVGRITLTPQPGLSTNYVITVDKTTGRLRFTNTADAFDTKVTDALNQITLANVSYSVSNNNGNIMIAKAYTTVSLAGSMQVALIGAYTSSANYKITFDFTANAYKFTNIDNPADSAIVDQYGRVRLGGTNGNWYVITGGTSQIAIARYNQTVMTSALPEIMVGGISYSIKESADGAVELFKKDLRVGADQYTVAYDKTAANFIFTDKNGVTSTSVSGIVKLGAYKYDVSLENNAAKVTEKTVTLAGSVYHIKYNADDSYVFEAVITTNVSAGDLKDAGQDYSLIMTQDGKIDAVGKSLILNNKNYIVSYDKDTAEYTFKDEADDQFVSKGSLVKIDGYLYTMAIADHKVILTEAIRTLGGVQYRLKDNGDGTYNVVNTATQEPTNVDASGIVKLGGIDYIVIPAADGMKDEIIRKVFAASISGVYANYDIAFNRGTRAYTFTNIATPAAIYTSSADRIRMDDKDYDISIRDNGIKLTERMLAIAGNLYHVRYNGAGNYTFTNANNYIAYEYTTGMGGTILLDDSIECTVTVNADGTVSLFKKVATDGTNEYEVSYEPSTKVFTLTDVVSPFASYTTQAGMFIMGGYLYELSVDKQVCVLTKKTISRGSSQYYVRYNAPDSYTFINVTIPAAIYTSSDAGSAVTIAGINYEIAKNAAGFVTTLVQSNTTVTNPDGTITNYEISIDQATGNYIFDDNGVTSTSESGIVKLGAYKYTVSLENNAVKLTENTLTLAGSDYRIKYDAADGYVFEAVITADLKAGGKEYSLIMTKDGKVDVVEKNLILNNINYVVLYDKDTDEYTFKDESNKTFTSKGTLVKIGGYLYTISIADHKVVLTEYIRSLAGAQYKLKDNGDGTYKVTNTATQESTNVTASGIVKLGGIDYIVIPAADGMKDEIVRKVLAVSLGGGISADYDMTFNRGTRSYTLTNIETPAAIYTSSADRIRMADHDYDISIRDNGLKLAERMLAIAGNLYHVRYNGAENYTFTNAYSYKAYEYTTGTGGTILLDDYTPCTIMANADGTVSLFEKFTTDGTNVYDVSYEPSTKVFTITDIISPSTSYTTQAGTFVMGEYLYELSVDKQACILTKKTIARGSSQYYVRYNAPDSYTFINVAIPAAIYTSSSAGSAVTIAGIDYAIVRNASDIVTAFIQRGTAVTNPDGTITNYEISIDQATGNYIFDDKVHTPIISTGNLVTIEGSVYGISVADHALTLTAKKILVGMDYYSVKDNADGTFALQTSVSYNSRADGTVVAAGVEYKINTNADGTVSVLQKEIVFNGTTYIVGQAVTGELTFTNKANTVEIITVNNGLAVIGGYQYAVTVTDGVPMFTEKNIELGAAKTIYRVRYNSPGSYTFTNNLTQAEATSINGVVTIGTKQYEVMVKADSIIDLVEKYKQVVSGGYTTDYIVDYNTNGTITLTDNGNRDLIATSAAGVIKLAGYAYDISIQDSAVVLAERILKVGAAQADYRVKYQSPGVWMLTKVSDGSTYISVDGVVKIGTVNYEVVAKQDGTIDLIERTFVLFTTTYTVNDNGDGSYTFVDPATNQYIARNGVVTINGRIYGVTTPNNAIVLTEKTITVGAGLYRGWFNTTKGVYVLGKISDGSIIESNTAGIFEMDNKLYRASRTADGVVTLAEEKVVLLSEVYSAELSADKTKVTIKNAGLTKTYTLTLNKVENIEGRFFRVSRMADGTFLFEERTAIVPNRNIILHRLVAPDTKTYFVDADNNMYLQTKQTIDVNGQPVDVYYAEIKGFLYRVRYDVNTDPSLTEVGLILNNVSYRIRHNQDSTYTLIDAATGAERTSDLTGEIDMGGTLYKVKANANGSIDLLDKSISILNGTYDIKFDGTNYRFTDSVTKKIYASNKKDGLDVILIEGYFYRVTKDNTGKIVLTQMPKPDVTGEGMVDEDDLEMIEANMAIQTQVDRADMNGNGIINFEDYKSLKEALPVISGGSMPMTAEELQDIATYARNSYLQTKALEYDVRKAARNAGKYGSTAIPALAYQYTTEVGIITQSDLDEFLDALQKKDGLFDFTQDGLIDDNDYKWISNLSQLMSIYYTYAGSANINNPRKFIQDAWAKADVDNDNDVDGDDWEIISRSYANYGDTSYDVSGDNGIIDRADVELTWHMVEEIWPGAYENDGVHTPSSLWPDGVGEGSRDGESVLSGRQYAQSLDYTYADFERSPDHKTLTSVAKDAEISYTVDIEETGKYYVGLSARNIVGQEVPEDFNYLVWAYVDGDYFGSFNVSSSEGRYEEGKVRLNLTKGEDKVITFKFKNISPTHGIQVKDVYVNRSGISFANFDIDRDGTITTADATLLTEYYDGLAIDTYGTYDIDENGSVDSADVNRIKSVVEANDGLPVITGTADYTTNVNCDLDNNGKIDENDIDGLKDILNENDTNLDGKLNGTDKDRITEIARYYIAQKAYTYVGDSYSGEGHYLMDFNGDGYINSIDSDRYTEALSAVDFDGDHKITSADQALMDKIIALFEVGISEKDLEILDLTGDATYAVTDGVSTSSLASGNDVTIKGRHFTLTRDQETGRMMLVEKAKASDVAYGDGFTIDGKKYTVQSRGDTALFTVNDGVTEYITDDNGMVAIGGFNYKIAKDAATGIVSIAFVPKTSGSARSAVVTVQDKRFEVWRDATTGRFVFSDGLNTLISNSVTNKVNIAGIVYDIAVGDYTTNGVIKLTRAYIDTISAAGSVTIGSDAYSVSESLGIYTFTKGASSYKSYNILTNKYVDINGVVYRLTPSASNVIVREETSSKELSLDVISVGTDLMFVKLNSDDTYTFMNTTEGTAYKSNARGDEVTIDGYQYGIWTDNNGKVSIVLKGESNVPTADQVIEVVTQYSGMRDRGVQYRVTDIPGIPKPTHQFSDGTNIYKSRWISPTEEIVSFVDYTFKVATDSVTGNVTLTYVKKTVETPAEVITPATSLNVLSKTVSEGVISIGGFEYEIKNEAGTYSLTRGENAPIVLGAAGSLASVNGRNYRVVGDFTTGKLIKLDLESPAVTTKAAEAVDIDGVTYYLKDDGNLYTGVNSVTPSTVPAVAGYVKIPKGDGSSKVRYVKDTTAAISVTGESTDAVTINGIKYGIIG
ncbi:MAG: hypothetical protein WCT15_01495, partial [Candidatus Omnitrophota bacterium]